MGGGKGGSTNVSQRPLTQQELDLLSTQKDALSQSMGIAQDQNNLSKQNQSDWNSAYRSIETGAMSPNATRANGYNSDQNIVTPEQYSAMQSQYNNNISDYNKQIDALQGQLNGISPTVTNQTMTYSQVPTSPWLKNMASKSPLGAIQSQGKGTPTTTTSANPAYTDLQNQINAYKSKVNDANSALGKMQIYNNDPNSNLREAMLQANEQMGTVDQGAYTRNKANMFNGLSSGYSAAQDQLDAEMAKRGLSNSGAAVQSMKDLYTNKANAMAQANNQAYNQGVQSGDAYRQQRVANLTGYSQLGRGMAGTAQNYLGQSAGTYGQAAQIAGSTANGIGQNNTSYMGNAMQAKSSAKGGMGQLLGTGIGAYAALA